MKFEFKRSIGWAEVVATAALLVSSYALVQSREANRPDIQVIQENTFSGIYDVGQRRKLLAYLPVSISNRGGRAATLLRIGADSSLEPFLAVRRGRFFQKVPEIAVFRVPEARDSIRLDLLRLTRYRNEAFDGLSALNIVIGPGEAQTLALGFVIEADSIEDSSPDMLVFAATLYFSNGDRRPLHETFSLRSAFSEESYR